MQIDRYIDILSAALTPLVAVATVFIAYKQYRIERFLAKDALYKRRIEVYDAANEFCGEIAIDGNLTDGTRKRFISAATEASFLFGPDVAELVEAILKRGISAEVAKQTIKSSSLEAEIQLQHQVRDCQQWLLSAEDRLATLVRPYLSLTKEVSLK